VNLKDKVAIITGATTGIGRGIAERFAADGAHVGVNYRGGKDPEARRREVGEMLKSLKTEGVGVEGDASRRGDIERMVGEVVKKFGRLDIAVANAGVEFKRPFLEATDEEWRAVLELNLYGAFVLAQTAARQMVKQGGGGKIIFISSVHEDIPFPQYTAYCASKGGVRMMMRNIAMELAPHGINVNDIAPGAIATPINRSVLENPEEKAKAVDEIPWGRFGRPEEVAAVAAFLASDEAEYVTGSTYYVDGGLTQQVTKY
jgi:glucose 1-dehydrogenase